MPRSLKGLLWFALLAVFIVACNQQSSSPQIAQPSQPETVGYQLGLITSVYTPDSSGQDQGLSQQALTDVFGVGGAKNGPLAKAGIHLARAYRNYEANAAQLSPQSLENALQSVTVDAVATSDSAELLRDLQAVGLTNGVAQGRIVSGSLPASAIAEAAQLGSLLEMRPSVAVLDVGLVTSEADETVRSDDVRAKLGYDGSGIQVGILSDSFARVNVDCIPDPAQGIYQEDGPPIVANYPDDVASGDLPADVLLLDDSVPCSDPGDLIDEGRAMAQLVYDLAPGSDLAFHTAFGGQADFAQGIIELADAGSDVIVDDVIYFAEPMFQDGVIAQAVDTVATDYDVPYFSSAGNRSDRSYESPFNNSGITGALGGALHDWDPGPGVQLCQTYTLQPGETFIPALQWDEPFASASPLSPGSSSDVDMYLTLEDCSIVPIPDFISAANNIGGDPFEIFGIGLSAPLTLGVAIELASGPEPDLLKYVNFGSSSVAFDPPLDAPTSYGHNNAAHGRGVAAAFYADSPAFNGPKELESFSSFGGIPTLFDVDGNRLANPVVRQQPDITAPDGTNTTFFFRDTVRDDDDGDGIFATAEPGEFPNFFGTSAAAPHAAAVAALMRQAKPNLSPDQIYGAMEKTAKNIGPKRVDFEAGWGLIDAFLSLKAINAKKIK